MPSDSQDMPAWAPPVLFFVFLLMQIPALVWVGSALQPGADLAAERADLIVPGLWITWGIAFLVAVGVLQSSRWGEPWSPAALLVIFFGSLLPLSYVLIGGVGDITRLPTVGQFWGLVGDNLFAIILWGVCLALYVVNVWMIWRSRWLVEWAPEGLLLLFAVSLVPAVYFLGGKIVELTGQFFGESFLLGSQLKSAPWAATAWFVNVMAL
ncbi:MAG: hypothetical protein KGZ25_11450, partial [Planctomycetes bacterium]|nr:hypothetical protein [Planctomycetota bacterium]